MTTAGDLDKVRLLLSGGCDANACNHDRRTCLHLASGAGQAHIVQALVEAKASGGHAVNVVFDHYEMLPDGFFRSRLPSVKIFVDFHHAVLRNRDDLLSFDHVYCSDPETHQAIRDLTGRDSDIFLPLSDFTPVPVLPPAPPGVDLYFSGAILKDYSPRREALVARIVGACPDATTLFVDGRLPRAEYERLSAGCRLEAECKRARPHRRLCRRRRGLELVPRT